jgi:DNA polymerase-3 subunit chi
MTRIDFHTKVPDTIGYTCRLVRLAANDGWQVVVACSDEAELARLDAALWTFSEQDFLPHVRAGDALAEETPIILAVREDEPLPHHRLLINLASVMPAHFARFERLLEVVSTEDGALTAGRERYAHYKQRGYPLKHYDRSANEQPVA